MTRVLWAEEDDGSHERVLTVAGSSLQCGNCDRPGWNWINDCVQNWVVIRTMGRN